MRWIHLLQKYKSGNVVIFPRTKIWVYQINVVLPFSSNERIWYWWTWSKYLNIRQTNQWNDTCTSKVDAIHKRKCIACQLHSMAWEKLESLTSSWFTLLREKCLILFCRIIQQTSKPVYFIFLYAFVLHHMKKIACFIPFDGGIFIRVIPINVIVKTCKKKKRNCIKRRFLWRL